MSLSVAQSVIIIQLPSLLLPVSVAPELLSVRQLDPCISQWEDGYFLQPW